ncbi:hypothetical protein KIH41_04000 [Litoribacter ruber]|uniref:M1 family aminopeptidase n=1 Tax=Litoribacter ruber TaxID=702568 RepID=UPI001BDB04C6|nr:M1 family aminopeptidase [Litoribacter ruber]MBT0810437.1 hypothetical protein [Litoribacter ruber]
MNKLATLLLIALAFYTTNFGAESKKEKKPTLVEGELKISIEDEAIEATLNITFVVKDSARASTSFWMDSAMEIQSVDGDLVKSYSFDQEAKPFATLTIDFKEALSEGEEIAFSFAYSGKPSQGFWIEEYQWVDIDPDFMILPVFSTLESFDYRIKAVVDDVNYKLIDVQKGKLTQEVEVTSGTTSYYINPILASNNQKNGVGLYDYSADGKEVRVFSEYADSARYVGDAALRIFDFFNSTFAREEPVTFCSVLYRPIPYDEHKVTRSFKPSVVFAKPHENIATLAHEISHFWWNRGDALTTEKWLTESFAQYSEMMFIRYEQGEDKFNMIIEKLADRAEKLPPLLGGDRFGRYGDALIYEKGPYILYQLENRLGYEKFVDFMVAVNREQVATTPHLLEVLENQTSAKIRKEFEELIKR